MVVVLADGGWDTTFVFDPKLGLPNIMGPEVDLVPGVADDVEEVRTFGDIPIVCNEWKRPAVTSFFEAWHDRAVVINGIFCESIAHQPARARMMTGTKHASSPDLATILGYAHGGTKPLGTIDFSGRGFMGPLTHSSGRVGTTSQLRNLIDDTSWFPAPEGADYTLPTHTPSDDAKALLASHLRSRHEGFVPPAGQHNAHLLDALHTSRERASRLVNEASGSLYDLYPGYWPDFDTQTSLAIDLLAKGVCQTVTLGLDGFDSHATNAVQHSLYERLFTVLADIGADLEAAGLLEETLVVVVSDMARIPFINYDDGKDHWPHTSMLLFGGGLNGGRVYGGTDDTLESSSVDLATGEVFAKGQQLKYDHVCAGILTACDIDPGEWLPNVEPLRGPFA
jgi:hypothetical protein